MDALLGSYITPTVHPDGRPRAGARRRARAHRRGPEEPRRSTTWSRASARSTTSSRATRSAKIAARRGHPRRPRPRRSARRSRPTQRELVDRLLGNGPLRPSTAADLPDDVHDRPARARRRPRTRGPRVPASRATCSGKGPRSRSSSGSSGRRRRRAPRPGEKPARVAGSLALSSDILDSVRRDGVLASAAAFGGVVVVVVLLLRGAARDAAWSSARSCSACSGSPAR